MKILSKRREESLSVYGTINNCLLESQSKENSLMQQERQVKNTVISSEKLPKKEIQCYADNLKNDMHLIFIIDRSTSMIGTEIDICREFERLIENNKEKKIRVSFALFNNYIEKVYDDIPIQNISRMLYACYGGTNLYDNASKIISEMDKRYPSMNENMIYIMATDGDDNSSQYPEEIASKKSSLKHIIEEQKKKGRKFFFLGEGFDISREAYDIGINSSCATNFSRENNGWSINFNAFDKIINQLAINNNVPLDWKVEIEKNCFQLEDTRKRYLTRYQNK